MASILKINPALAAQDLVSYYGYQSGGVTEVNGGSVGYNYSIDGKFFLKLYDTELVITKRCTENLLEQLQVLEILQNKTTLKDKICYPIKTVDGGLFYSHDNVIGVLFNLIAGSAIGYVNEYSTEEILQIAQIVKDLHGIESSQFNHICPKETFDLDFTNQFISLMELRTGELPDQFRTVTVKYQAAAIKKVSQCKALAEKLKEMKLPFVLCHTDIHGGNVMRDPKGKLYLVDWENIILAPKEADLFSFCEKEYFRQFSTDANETALLYYLIRRDLEDLWEFLNSVLHSEYDEEELIEVYGHIQRIFNHLTCTGSCRLLD